MSTSSNGTEAHLVTSAAGYEPYLSLLIERLRFFAACRPDVREPTLMLVQYLQSFRASSTAPDKAEVGIPEPSMMAQSSNPSASQDQATCSSPPVEPVMDAAPTTPLGDADLEEDDGEGDIIAAAPTGGLAGTPPSATSPAPGGCYRAR